MPKSHELAHFLSRNADLARTNLAIPSFSELPFILGTYMVLSIT